jgi:hypothetical protein
MRLIKSFRNQTANVRLKLNWTMRNHNVAISDSHTAAQNVAFATVTTRIA